MTPETAQLLTQLLDSVTLSASDPGLEEAAAKIAAARRELEAELAAQTASSPEQS